MSSIDSAELDAKINEIQKSLASRGLVAREQRGLDVPINSQLSKQTKQISTPLQFLQSLPFSPVYLVIPIVSAGVLIYAKPRFLYIVDSNKKPIFSFARLLIGTLVLSAIFIIVIYWWNNR